MHHQTLPPIRIDETNPHLLQTVSGVPFLLLGDTAWELFHRLTIDEIALYFANRHDKGFNAVLVNLIAEFDGLNTPNIAGLHPLHDNNPNTPNSDYFDFVETVVTMAAENGLYVGLLPAWGDKITAPWGTGPRLFNLENLPDAHTYGRFLGERFAAHTNILWVLGGDRPATMEPVRDEALRRNLDAAGFAPDEDWKPIWRTMADGLSDGSTERRLITYHPQGGAQSSSYFLHNEPWLDINMMQSGHGGGHDIPVWERIERDTSLLPVKPTLDGEPNYEDHPVSPWPVYKPENGYFRDDDVRRQCWRSILAGGCGVVYGHHSIWQFYSEKFEIINHADRYWMEALDRPGAFHVGHLRRFMETQTDSTRIADQSVVVSEIGSGKEHIRAARAANGDYAIVYIPTGKPVLVDGTKLSGETINAEWFDPRTGDYTKIGDFERKNDLKFMPPTEGTDWVLLLRTANK